MSVAPGSTVGGSNMSPTASDVKLSGHNYSNWSEIQSNSNDVKKKKKNLTFAARVFIFISSLHPVLHGGGLITYSVFDWPANEQIFTTVSWKSTRAECTKRSRPVAASVDTRVWIMSPFPFMNKHRRRGGSWRVGGREWWGVLLRGLLPCTAMLPLWCHSR